MNTNDLTAATIDLPKGAIHRLHARIGQRIEALAGVLWVTIDNDLRDIVVQPGDGFDVDHAGDALVSALSPARFIVLESRSAPAN